MIKTDKFDVLIDYGWTSDCSRSNDGTNKLTNHLRHSLNDLLVDASQALLKNIRVIRENNILSYKNRCILLFFFLP